MDYTKKRVFEYEKKRKFDLLQSSFLPYLIYGNPLHYICNIHLHTLLETEQSEKQKYIY